MTKSESQNSWVWLTFFALATFLHVMGIGQPFLGNFAQHQTDYATVVQRWLEYGINPLVPMMRFMADGETRIFLGDIPWTMVLTALFSKLSFLSVDMAGRAVSVVLFFLSLWPFKRILEMTSQDAQFQKWTLFFYLFSPLTLIYGQAFLLEIPALTLGLFGYYFMMKWLGENKEQHLYVSALLFSLMLGTRIYYAPVLLPVLGLFYQKYGWRFMRSRQLCCFGLLTLSLPIVWQLYAMKYASFHGQESSLQDNFRIFVTDDPLLKEHRENVRYYLPILDIFLQKIVNPIGFGFALLGLLLPHVKNEKVRVYSYLSIISYMILFVVAIRKFVEFEYYYMPLVPFFAILAGHAISKLQSFRFAAFVIMACIALFSIRYSFAPIMITPEEFRGVDKAAAQVRKNVPKGSLVVASHRSTPFLYYVNRDGWAFGLESERDVPVRHHEDLSGTPVERLERFRKQGAEYFALMNPGTVAIPPKLQSHLENRARKIHDSEQVVVYALDRP